MTLSSAFDFDAIVQHFAQICEDFGSELTLETPSKAVEFCSKMIYEVGPEARQVRKKDGDKTWRFMFVYNNDGKLKTKVAFVSTYKADDASYKIEAEPTRITLSVKTASLLAIMILNKLNEISMNMDAQVILLSPLAGSVFSKDDIPLMARTMNVTPHKVVSIINASCQSGGHYLKDSRLHCAAVGAIVATRGVKDKRMRDAIIGKTVKQYLNVKKPMNVTFFNVYAEFGHGGMPSDLSPDNLIKLFDDIQKVTPIQAARAGRQTRREARITAPHVPATPGRVTGQQVSEGLEIAAALASSKGAVPRSTRPQTPTE